MTIIHKTVNGKQLTGFEKYNGSQRRSAGRRLLAHHDEINRVEEGGGADLTAWIETTQVNWSCPLDGWRIDEVSFFSTDEWRSPSLAVDLVREGDDD